MLQISIAVISADNDEELETEATIIDNSSSTEGREGLRPKVCDSFWSLSRFADKNVQAAHRMTSQNSRRRIIVAIK
jgi:hypothetical protein